MTRLDTLLVEKGFAVSRKRAKELIESGLVTINGKTETKAAKEYAEDIEIAVTGDVCRYVGRGGLKLEKALTEFVITLENSVCLDIGASTGGFTDCMLQHGAKKVYAVDVGHGQLDGRLLSDERVINLEGVNFREVEKDFLLEQVDFISVDVSFISLTIILPKAALFLKEKGKAVLLIKPQFEAGRENIGKNGIVKSKKAHKAVLDKISQYIVDDINWVLNDIIVSPVKGGSGNIEYLAYVECCNDDKLYKDNDMKASCKVINIDTAEIVNNAFLRME